MRRVSVPLLLTLLSAGCNGGPTFETAPELNLDFVPPPGWTLVAGGNLPLSRGTYEPPLPRLDKTGKTQERLIARYDHSISGGQAWIRVSQAISDPTRSFRKYVSAKSPGSGWRLKSEARELDCESVQAYRVVFAGRWQDQEYLNETVAIRRGRQVYIITASFPAADEHLRAQVRESIVNAIEPL
jgi:hypothetical protein